MVCLPDGEKYFDKNIIPVFISTEYTNVTDRKQKDGHTHTDRHRTTA